VSEPNVLVVEDDDTIRRLLVEYLRVQTHIEVEGARDGVEALHLISTRHYRVVLLDVMMPKMSGIDLLDSLQAFRADPSLQRARSSDWPAIIIITSTPDTVLSRDVLDHHFPGLIRDVFRKPLDVGALAGLVEKCLRQ
jgi:two-component system response regulator CpxR